MWQLHRKRFSFAELRRRRPAQGSGVDAAAPSERVAVLGFTRAAYEKAVAGLRKALESGKG